MVRLTSIVYSYGSTPDSNIIANVISGNTVVVHSIPAGILSLSDIGHYKMACFIHHGYRELLITSEPGIVHSGTWIVNQTWQNEILFISIFIGFIDIDIWVLACKQSWQSNS